MHRASNIIKRGLLYITALVLVAGYPAAVMATPQEPVTSEVPVTVTTTEPEAPEKNPELTYTFDPTSEKWNSEEWWFNPDSGAYEKPPTPIIIEAIPESQSVDEAPADDVDQTVDKTIKTTVDVGTVVDSSATSGDSLIASNTEAGSALTGDAVAVANIINSVNSSITTDSNQKITTFTKDIMGDVEGDIVLYPLLLKAMLEAQANNTSATTLNADTNLNLNNDITVNAASGDATVEGNTIAGDATTGNATAMANVINILNSMIAAQESFIGTINIYGSLDGDILIAPDFIPQLLASNGDSGAASNMQLSTQDTTTIVNNITAVAESGAASVFGNTTGGSATSGSADSNVVIFNVTGHDIVAANSMLIFVNVLGKWVGLILDAPAGTTAAMFGSDVTKNEAYAPDLTLESRSEHGITNTVAVTASTGDATVANNTHAGNATTGNAAAMVNVANFSGSQVSLTGWFRMLFINITEDWNGSLRIASIPYGTSASQSVSTPEGPLQFIPKAERPSQPASRGASYTLIDSRSLQSTASVAASVVTDAQSDKMNPVAASDVKGATEDASSVEDKTAPVKPQNPTVWAAAGAVFLVAVSILGLRRFV